MKVNLFKLFIFMAFAAFAGQEELAIASQFFKDARAQAFKTFDSIQREVLWDLEELGRGQGRIADDLILEAKGYDGQEEEFSYAERFKDSLDAAIDRAGWQFMHHVAVVPSVKPWLTAVMDSLYFKRSHCEKRIVDQLCYGHAPQAKQLGGAVPSTTEDAEISAKTVGDFNALLRIRPLMRGYRTARANKIDAFVDAVIKEIDAVLNKMPPQGHTWAVRVAIEILKEEPLLQSFVDLPPELPRARAYVDGGDVILEEDLEYQREKIVFKQKNRRAGLRWLILKILNDIVTPDNPDGLSVPGAILKEHVMFAAKIIFDEKRKKIEAILPKPLPTECLMEVVGQNVIPIGRAVPAILRVAPNFVLAMAQIPNIQERLFAIMTGVHSNAEENKLILQKLSREETFQTGLVWLENRALQQQLGVRILGRNLFQELQKTQNTAVNTVLDVMRTEGDLQAVAESIATPHPGGGPEIRGIMPYLLRESISQCAAILVKSTTRKVD